MRKVFLAAVVLMFVALQAEAKEVSSTEVLADPSTFTGKTVTLTGTFAYSEPMRGSFTIEQNKNQVEVFYQNLPKADKDGILSQKQYSKTPVTVTGTVQFYKNKPGSFFVDAASLKMDSASDDPAPAAGGSTVAVGTILSNVKKYAGRTVSVRGMFAYNEPLRESFAFDQKGTVVEVFYSSLTKNEKDLILSQKKNSTTGLIITGVVQAYTNKPDTFFMNATSVRLDN